jgi:hypothetical protein
MTIDHANSALARWRRADERIAVRQLRVQESCGTFTGDFDSRNAHWFLRWRRVATTPRRSERLAHHQDARCLRRISIVDGSAVDDSKADRPEVSRRPCATTIDFDRSLLLAGRCVSSVIRGVFYGGRNPHAVRMRIATHLGTRRNGPPMRLSKHSGISRLRALPCQGTMPVFSRSGAATRPSCDRGWAGRDVFSGTLRAASL